MAIVQIRGLIEYQWEFVAEKRAGWVLRVSCELEDWRVCQLGSTSHVTMMSLTLNYFPR